MNPPGGAASLSYGQLAVALAWSGVDLPARGVRPCRDEVLTLGALGVDRRGLEAIRAAEEQARALRLADQPEAASRLYGGLARAERAHDLAYSALFASHAPGHGGHRAATATDSVGEVA